MDHPFRSAAFGGFNRQDVLTYLENTAKENGEKQQQLQQQLDEARETAAGQSARLREQEERLVALEAENQQLREQLEGLNRDLTDSRERERRGAEELERTRGELEAARSRVAALEPDAAAYAAVKERTAGVELEAHCRAQGIQNRAEEQARQLHRQLEQWLQRVEREYDGLRSQVECTVSHAADQLDKARGCLEQVSALMGEQDAALEALARTCTQAGPARVAAPVPIPESDC